MRVHYLVLCMLVSCRGEQTAPRHEPASPQRTATTTTAAPTVTSNQKPTPSGADALDSATPPEITIESITIANPVVVTGRARTFENNVVIRVRDSRGNLLKETFTTSEGEMGHHNPYRAEIWLTRDPGPRMTVETLEYSAKDGSERSLARTVRPFDVEIIEISLRFPNADCTGLVSAKRRVPKSVAMARLLVESVMTHGVFPKGSAVQSVILREGVLTVDFNERLQNVGGSCAAQMIRASVTETLMQLPAIKRVVITAAGSEKLALQP